jgi:REP element-mobilizing transposase RayT
LYYQKFRALHFAALGTSRALSFAASPHSVRKGYAFLEVTLLWRLRLMFRISKDSPVHNITSVTHNRLPVFKTTKLKEVMCDALKEARTSWDLLIFAYVIMPDHLHALIGSHLKPSKVLRYVNGISGHRIIEHLKESGSEASLAKLQQETRPREYKYSLWDHHPNLKLITTENGLMEKANYIHLNPVRAGLVERAEDYRFSSVRCWQRKPLEDEPLLMDLDKVAWHK